MIQKEQKSLKRLLAVTTILILTLSIPFIVVVGNFTEWVVIDTFWYLIIDHRIIE